MTSATPLRPSQTTQAAPPRAPGKPRIAIMGEFSAGKSTLTNMLIGRLALPTKVTATQLPPVWISYGDAPAYRRTLDGEDLPVDMEDLASATPAETEYIRIFHQADTLQMFDLIDLPGISDPNMPADVWQRVVGVADAVIWCTHATQAWRQSEAAVWDSFAEKLAKRSLLLVTRIDKIIEAKDRERLLRRLTLETEGLFRGIYPISLTEALAAESNFELWDRSGADAVASALIALSQELLTEFGTARQRPAADVSPDKSVEAQGPTSEPSSNIHVLHRTQHSTAPQARAEGHVLPRRIAMGTPGNPRRARLQADGP